MSRVYLQKITLLLKIQYKIHVKSLKGQLTVVGDYMYKGIVPIKVGLALIRRVFPPRSRYS